MYNVPYFKAKNNEDVLAFMQAHPFIILCGCQNNIPVATHIPVLIEERENKIFLLGHVMRKQQHTVVYEQNENVLAIFSGVSSYISASLYTIPNTASTYNYAAVHATGIMRFVDDERLLTILTKLTDFFEGGENSPASVNNIHQSYLHQHMKAIVGFEIEITNIQHIFKYSQNKDEASFKNIIQHLEHGTAEQQILAQEMKRTF